MYACSSTVDPGASATSDPASTSQDAAPRAPVPSQDGGDSASPASGDAGADASPAAPEVRFVGRFDGSSAAGPKVSWAGAQIVARFSGTEVHATFDDTMAFNDYGTDRWEVVIDGTSAMTFQLDRAPRSYTLATGLAAGTHTVELWKLTEATVGTSQFMGFEFPGGALLAPPPAKTRHLEFIGDSGSNGYGIDGAPGCAFTAATQNAHKAYPALIASDLDADHFNLATSGKGLYYNAYRPDLDTFPVLYPRTLTFSETSLWNFTSYTPDVVWLTLGGIDYNDPDYDSSTAPDPPPPGAFQSKYVDLLGTVRAHYPAAHVFCAIAPSLNDQYPPGYNAYTHVKTAVQNAVSAKASSGDTRIYFFEFTRSTPSDNTACDGHTNANKHRAMATEAVAFIKAKTLWP